MRRLNVIFCFQHLLEPVEVLVVSPEPAEGDCSLAWLLPEGVQGLPDLGLGVFLVTPRLYDPEAEGWKSLIDQYLTKIEAQRIEGLISSMGLRCRTIYIHHGPFIEIFRPRAARASRDY